MDRSNIRKMSNEKNSGLTLIEVILSIALIGLIASIFLPSMMSSLSMMFRAKDLTEEIYRARQDIDKEIETVRSNKIVDDNKEYVYLFGKKIDGDWISQPISNNYDIRVFIPEVPEVENHRLIEILPKIDTDSVEIITKGPIYGFGAVQKLEGSSGILEDNTNYYKSLYNWYISKPGFEGYVPDIVDNSNEGTFGSRYPSWPEDYIRITKDYLQTNKELGDLKSYVSDYQGRHIVYTITPVSNIGMFGIEVPSKPVFLVGLPVLSLYIHLDVDTVQQEITEENEVQMVWEDILNSSNIKTEQAITFKYLENLGKFAEFNNKKATIKTSRSMDTFTIFVVLNRTSSEANKSYNILSRYDGSKGWKLHLEEGKIGLVAGDYGINTNVLIDNQKHVITYQVTKGTNNGTVKLLLDKEELDNKNNINTSNISYGGNIIIGDDNSEINSYEMIIYDYALTSDEINKVNDYLLNKHKINIEP